MHENRRLARRCIPLLYNGTVHSRPTEKKKDRKIKKKKRIQVEQQCSTTLLPDLIACLNTALAASTHCTYILYWVYMHSKPYPHPQSYFHERVYDDLAPFLSTGERRGHAGPGLSCTVYCTVLYSRGKGAVGHRQLRGLVFCLQLLLRRRGIPKVDISHCDWWWMTYFSGPQHNTLDTYCPHQPRGTYARRLCPCDGDWRKNET